MMTTKMIIMKNDWNFLWPNAKWLRLHIESAPYASVDFKRDDLNHSAHTHTFQHISPLIRWDSTLLFGCSRAFFLVFILNARKDYLKALHFCSFVIASQFACHTSECGIKRRVQYGMIQFQVSALWSFSLHAFLYIIVLGARTHNIPPILFVNLNMTSALYTRC